MSERKTLSDARKRANKKWNDETLSKKYDRIQLVVPKGRKADIEACAKAKGMSVNGWICGYIREAAGMSEEEWKRATDEQVET